MSYSVFVNSQDITQFVISYTREKEICDGIGRALIKVTKNIANIKPWDVITIYENNQKVGMFYVSSISNALPPNSFDIAAQDGSKKLTDYFLGNILTPKNTIKYAKQLIEDVADEAKVDVVFNVSGNGAPVAPESQIGLQSAYDSILNLAQQSGWYFYFDKNNICKVGKLKASLSNIKKVIQDNEIISFSYNYNDNSLRNKAVVWGGFDRISNKQIFFSKRVTTPWDRHKKDIRSIVLSNGTIYSLSIAKYLANLLLSEFSKLNKEKSIILAGLHNLEVGDVVRIPSFKITGLVTGLKVSVETGGIKTELIIDKRCPRLFGWFDWGKNPDYHDYVYVGTDGGGVKRKPIGSGGWNDFSSGLYNLTIKDLRIYGGNFICVADDGYAYIRDEDTSWKRLNHGSFFDSQGVEYTEQNVKAAYCSIDQVTGDFYVGYNYYREGTNFTSFRSWVAIFDLSGNLKTKLPVELYFTNKLLINHLDHYANTTLIAGIGDSSDFDKLGYRDVYSPNLSESTLPFIYGVLPYSTSGAILSDKYAENGGYVYSGVFLEGSARNLCLFRFENDWRKTQSLYDNGRIFVLGLDGLRIFDFTPSGYTKLTGFPIFYPQNRLIASGIYPDFGFHHRFLYLDKQPDHPELHALFVNNYGYRTIYHGGGNTLTHLKYVFFDYSYMSLSGAELLHHGIFVDKNSFPYLETDGGFQRIYPQNGTFEVAEAMGEKSVFADNGKLLMNFYTINKPAFNVYLMYYNILTQQKQVFHVLKVNGIIKENAYGAPDVFPMSLSSIYPIPSQSKKEAFFIANCAAVDKRLVKKTGVGGQNCDFSVNDLRIVSKIIRISLDETPYINPSGFLNYVPNAPLGNDFINTEEASGLLAVSPNIIRVADIPFVGVDHMNSGDSCQDINDNCGNIYSSCTGNITWFLGSNPVTGKNKVLVRGQILDEKGTTVVDVFREIFYLCFYYVPSVFYPCCVGSSQHPRWCHRLLSDPVRILVNSDGEQLLGGLDATLPVTLSNYLVVPSGYSPTYISAEKITRGYNFFINKITGSDTEEKIQIPLFYEWGSFPLDHLVRHIDFFDESIYFFIPPHLYGIDYNTGILKKHVRDLSYDIVFGEKWAYHAPPTIHNGILFSRGAFWVFRTTLTGYFVFPILYQNNINTGIINVEIVPTNVDTSKLNCFVTYSPFEYRLPNVSGALLPFSGGKSTKIYSPDLTSFLSTEKTGNDVRVFDLIDFSIVDSGIVNDDNFRFVAIPESQTIFMRDINFTDSFSVLKTVSGTIYHIEFSNLLPKPFIFASTNTTFYEFDKDVWRTFSNPSSKILTIRVDDLL